MNRVQTRKARREAQAATLRQSGGAVSGGGVSPCFRQRQFFVADPTRPAIPAGTVEAARGVATAVAAIDAENPGNISAPA